MIKKIFSSCFLLFSFTIQSQQWREMMFQPDANLYDIQKTAEEYFKTIDLTQKGTGYKPYKRWENFARPRVYPSGNLSQLSLTAKNYSEFLENNSSARL